MSNYQSLPATREKTLDRMASIVRIGHDTQFKVHTKLEESITNIIAFGYKPTEPNKKYLYQYDPENQEEWSRYITPVISATHVIESLVSKTKTDMYRLQNLVPVEIDALTPVTPAPVEKEKKTEPTSLKQKIFGKKPSEKKSNEPYDIGLRSVYRDLAIIAKINLFVEYQSYGTKHSLKKSRKWIEWYKGVHYNRFQFEIASPLLRMHRQYIDLVLSVEKKHAVQIASSLSKEIFQTRNDFSLQPKP